MPGGLKKLELDLAVDEHVLGGMPVIIHPAKALLETGLLENLQCLLKCVRIVPPVVEVKVKVIGFDRGKVKLSIKAAV